MRRIIRPPRRQPTARKSRPTKLNRGGKVTKRPTPKRAVRPLVKTKPPVKLNRGGAVTKPPVKLNRGGAVKKPIRKKSPVKPVKLNEGGRVSKRKLARLKKEYNPVKLHTGGCNHAHPHTTPGSKEQVCIEKTSYSVRGGKGSRKLPIFTDSKRGVRSEWWEGAGRQKGRPRTPTYSRAGYHEPLSGTSLDCQPGSPGYPDCLHVIDPANTQVMANSTWEQRNRREKGERASTREAHDWVFSKGGKVKK